VGKPPQSPYPPDLADGATPVADFGDLVDVEAENVDWANQRARGFVARRAELRRWRFTGTELAEAMLVDVTFSDCRLDLVGLRAAKLERVAFRQCRMEECDFSDASLKDVLFERCELREAMFGSATIQRVELRGCDLTNLHGVEALRGVRMPWDDLLQNAPLFATALGIEIID
jgi:uncharacterized protein YjbI with pentapeptide repeats